ncbi:MAG: carboxypeptidase regulatory-like domain-containing protein, partial [Candidatus Dadabacteria bacterium]
GGPDGPIFDELAFVEVSLDGLTWRRFPADPETGRGMAGREPVVANSANGMDPLAPEAGGDRFDLAAVGLSYARFVRIIDAGAEADDAGNHVPGGGKAGFDLDAVAAANWVRPVRLRGTVRAGGVPVKGAFVRLVPPLGRRRPWRRTPASGRFRFWPLAPAGVYRVKARVAGRRTTVRRVVLDGSRRVVTVNVELP